MPVVQFYQCTLLDTFRTRKSCQTRIVKSTFPLCSDAWNWRLFYFLTILKRISDRSWHIRWGQILRPIFTCFLWMNKRQAFVIIRLLSLKKYETKYFLELLSFPDILSRIIFLVMKNSTWFKINMTEIWLESPDCNHLAVVVDITERSQVICILRVIPHTFF